MLTIRDVRVIVTAPAGTNLVIVKLETSEPGLYGLGCATFTQRCLAVKTAIEEYLRPLVIGRDADRIEELFGLMMVNAFWRNGPIMNNAISGIEMALWDIKGKRAGMPLYDLLGGKMREAAAVYCPADGREPKEIEDNVRRYMEQGVRHVRVQCGGYGGFRRDDAKPEGALEGAYYDPRRYRRDAIKAIEHMRVHIGDEVELLHDVHERLKPAEAVEFAKELEPYHLFFLEDLLAPEDIEWFENVRAVCTTPLAMGELFVNPREWTPLIARRQIDFVRMHISDMGGLIPARKVATMAEAFGVRTAWHGPNDVSPVGHALNVHLDLVLPNFGIQEFPGFPEKSFEVFIGCPELRNGYLYLNGKPGLGIDIDETAAAKYPHQERSSAWYQTRLPDGTIARP